MKQILVDKPCNCPFNIDDYCSNEDGSVKYCNDHLKNKDFPSDCPLKTPNVYLLNME